MAETTTNGERPREDPEKTLWMGDLAFEWDEAFIADLFEGFGAVTAYRPYDPRADRPTLYAFVTFESEAEATRAFEELNGATIPDTRRRFRLNPRSKRPERPGGADGAEAAPGRSPGGYDRRSPPGGRWRPGSRTPSRSPAPAALAARRDERPERSRPRDRGPGDPPRRPGPRPRRAAARAAGQRAAAAGPGGGRGLVRLALAGGRDGEVPPGVPVGKVLGDFTARFVAERPRQAESPEDTCWRRALELGGNGVVAALVDGVLVAASERVQHHHATLVPVLARSPFGFAVLRRTLAFVMQLSASIETPRLRLAVAGLAPGCAETNHWFGWS
ncbi:RNA binding-protein [Aureococcus anophagefferens]|nr:RNA binding-protein [Aureococcus anophagefferens]